MRSPLRTKTMNEQAVRVAFFPSLAALLALLGMSAYFAYTTGYSYGPTIRLGTYTAIAKGLGGVLGAALLAVIIVSLSLRMKQSGLEQALLRWLERNGEWAGRQYDEVMEMNLRQRIGSVDSQEAIQVENALRERTLTEKLRKYATRLLAVPVVALAILVGISLWSVLASGAFLDNFPLLNTAFIFLVSYGTVLALTTLVAALVIVLRG